MSGSDPSRQHVSAIKAVLDQAFTTGGEAYRVYPGEVTDSDEDLVYPYLIVWPAPGRRTVTNLDGSGHDVKTTTQITAVGQTDDEVLAALDRVADALQGVRAPLQGRRCGLIAQVDVNVPVVQSDQMRTPTGRPPFIGISQWELTSVPA